MRVLLTATVQSHICQFHRPLVDMLHEHGCEVHVAARNNLAEKNGLKLDFADKVFDLPFARSPKSMDNIRAYRQLKRIIDDGKYDVIHCNTPVGGVVTRLACRKVRKQGAKIFYTAHGFHFYKGAPLKNWLLYYPVEWLCAHFTDVLITINREDYQLAQKHMHAKRVEYVPGVGLDLEKFGKVTVDRNEKRRELGLPEDAVVLLSVGELNQNKNHQVILRALAQLNDSRIHYVIAGNGPLKEKLEELARALGLKDRFHLLGYRRDVDELYQAADVFCFPSLREGLGMAALEAMSYGLPLITSNVHGINDYSENGVTGFKSSPLDVTGFAIALQSLLSVDRKRIGQHNADIVKKYKVEDVIERMRDLYGLL